jgi:UDP-glucose 4-epimerase
LPLERDLRPAWVTGATSFLGRHVARRLAGQGHRVIGFSRNADAATSVASWGFSAVECGRFGMALFEQACARFGAPSVVFHAVGSGSVAQADADPQADVERTVWSAEQLIDALIRLSPSARLVYPSSAAVYGARPGPIAEDAPTRPISAYGRNKMLAEEICRERAKVSGVDIVVARFFSVYGPPQRKLLLWELGRRLLSGQKVITLSGTGEETRDFIHVCDVADVVVMLAGAADVPSLVNVGTGRATSISVLATKLAAALRVDARIAFSATPRPGDPEHQHADVTRLRAMGCASFIHLDAGLADYGEWLCATLPGHLAIRCAD